MKETKEQYIKHQLEQWATRRNIKVGTGYKRLNKNKSFAGGIVLELDKAKSDIENIFSNT